MLDRTNDRRVHVAASLALSEFVHAALSAGRPREDIVAALTSAGWSEREIADSLNQWTIAPDLPPVPRAQPYVSAREAMLYALLGIALVVVCAQTITLGFRIIDTLLPEIGEQFYSNDGIRFSIATLVVFLPALLWLDARLARKLSRDEAGRSRVRRGFASLTFLVAVLVLLGDLAVTVYALLAGDLTLRFAAKALLVAVTGVLALASYRADLDG